MALITNTDSSILPYNDDEMVYDIDRRLYVLTDLGVKRLTGYDLIELDGTVEGAEMIRYEVSQDIMNVIAMYSKLDAYDYKRWLIAKDASLRPLIKRVLADQIRYYIRSGAGLLKDMHGVHIEKGKALDINTIRGNALISQSAEVQLAKSGLLFVGYMYYSDYSDDGTW